MKRIIGMGFLFLICSQSTWGQTRDAFVKAAENSFANKDYFSALAYYSEVLEFDRETDILYKAAESARLFDAYSIAETHYEAVQNEESDGQYPESSFWLASMQQRQGKYEAARANYQIYLSENEGEDTYLSNKTRKEIEACSWAINEIENPRRNVNTERLGDDVNTPYSEFGAVAYEDKMFFSSLRFSKKEKKVYPDKLYSKVLIQGSDSIKVDGSIKSEDRIHAAHTAFNKEGNRMYFTLCEYLNDKDIRCDIYSRDRTGNAWSDAIKLPGHINVDGKTNTQPNVGFDSRIDKEVLYFVSDRDGGKGNLDIWYSIINEDEYSEPMNLMGINTVENDISPFFHSASQSLYFSSEGYLGFGGFDIYKVEQGEGWGKAEHMGSPLNSSYNDIYFTLAENGQDVLYSSNRTGSLYLENQNEACCYDIYSAEILPSEVILHAFTFDTETRDSLSGVNLIVEDIYSGNKEIFNLINLNSASFTDIIIKCGREYKISATKLGYKSADVSFGAPRCGGAKEITKLLYLDPDAVALEVQTFDQLTRLELKGSTIRLIDITDPDNEFEVDRKTNDLTHIFDFKPLKCRKYKIVADRPGYSRALDFFDVPCDTPDDSTITRKIYLIPAIYDLLPIRLFFDNDLPDRRTTRTKTKKTYSDTYDPYYARKGVFLKEYGSESSNTSQGEMDIESFFENDVKYGHERLEFFKKALVNELKKGGSLEIMIKGHASPRAATSYNKKLGSRRISSVLNDFRAYSGGILSPYIDSGKLRVVESTIGEDESPSGISDDLNDRRNSIFSPEASWERRVEIIQVTKTGDQ